MSTNSKFTQPAHPMRPSRPRRSVLYVPATNARAMTKTASLDCDAVVFDLEDSVAPDAKGKAREALRAFLAERPFDGKEIVVRINGLDSEWGTEDLLAARGAGVDTILLPKVEEPEDIQTAASALNQSDAPDTMRLWAMIETPKAIMNAGHIALSARTVGARLDCFIIGPNDIAKETGVPHLEGRPYLVPWLMQVVLAAKAFGLDILDGVYNDFRDLEGFERECGQGRDMGFDGKTLIHPGQIGAANRLFGIDRQALAEAERIIAAFDAPESAGLGVIQIDGKMVERLHRDQAEKLVAKAKALAARSQVSETGDEK
ncbi:HpcH/HpaI aldolase/citrate lyase family protein [Pararhizobium haloflavum]|uniref:HpcH/HpaI aldolase/citrate lyase family protein n=1 Tax=Pararhizobium haloflavum TaxID=2037914 RepID=UPI0035223CF0